MRKFLLLMCLAILGASASGCCGRQCGMGWRPFGMGQANYGNACCDPCAGAGAVVESPDACCQ